MELISQLCELGRTFSPAEALCINEVSQTAQSLVGIDYLKFREEFPTPEGPSNFPLYIVENKEASIAFVKGKAQRHNNSVIQLLEKKDEDVEGISKDIAEYLIEPNEKGIEQKEDIDPPGDTSPEPSPRADVRPGLSSPGGVLGVSPIIDIWDTTRYIPWISDPARGKISGGKKFRSETRLLGALVGKLKEYIKGGDMIYPFGKETAPKVELPGGSFLITLLNIITGIYSREEYAMLYVTKICYSNGGNGKRRERERQGKVLGHNRIPTGLDGDLVKFDEYDGDWGKLRAVVCLIRMQPQKDVKDEEGKLRGEDELAGTHWVAMIFTTGKRQDVSQKGLEVRGGRSKENRKPAEERRMYLIDPYVYITRAKIEERREDVDAIIRTPKYGEDRLKVLNRACWQCYNAGLISDKVMCSSGYQPDMHDPPHTRGLYEDNVSNWGILDYQLSFEPVVPSGDITIQNEIFYDRKVLITGLEKSELLRIPKEKERDILSRASREQRLKKVSMVIESVYPGCTMFYETPFVWMTEFYVISTIQSLILADTQRTRSEDLFPYTTAEIFYSMVRIANEGEARKDKESIKLLYNTSKVGGIIPYPGWYSPVHNYRWIYRDVNIPVISSNLRISLEILKRLNNQYKAY